MLKILHQNVRGLNTKLRNAFVSSVNSDYLVIAFTEIWLKPRIFDGEFGVSDLLVWQIAQN